MATCFVIQGFGKKTDFTDGRVLDLDASYAVIKEGVEGAGLTCIRADEIQHAGTIDVPMYQQLLKADLVIADLSTYNVNAAFELGIRYGLRPSATLIVAEECFKNPFDVSHIVIRRYKHLGEDIGAQEARRFRDDLKQAITAILANAQTDSPVYAFLPDLTPPWAKPADDQIAAPVSAPARVARGMQTFRPDETLSAMGLLTFESDNAFPQTAKANLEQAQAMLLAGDFSAACQLFQEIRKLRPNDSFIIQQLILATYKSEQPTPEAALNEAKAITQVLNPATTNDPETLGLWGAIHKKLWAITQQAGDLNESIEAYGRGFFLKQDYYNGINLAFLLEVRALNAFRAGEREEGIADLVLARRIRRDVIKYTEPLINKDYGPEKRYWILATLWEATAGLGDAASAEKWAAQARTLKMADWMTESTQTQIQNILNRQAEIALLNPESPAAKKKV
ncbi:TRAFs-binding domain-containing protein [Propionivibrio sp.]|uniref:TRAFs-binding domain-containing protein n=1 Tax=Propionivibrio sp. TaxID=2212460 RepID=UPI00262C744D|nr:TRAFs-binding domain-containing protein [Propionivibrio sp.]